MIQRNRSKQQLGIAQKTLVPGLTKTAFLAPGQGAIVSLWHNTEGQKGLKTQSEGSVICSVAKAIAVLTENLSLFFSTHTGQLTA